MALCKGRQDDTENGSFARRCIEFQGATVFIDDACGNRQPEACAIVLGAKKWVENERLNFRSDSRAGVSNFQEDRFGQLAIEEAVGFTRAQRYNAAVVESFGRIPDKVDENLFELLRVSQKQ